MVHSDKQRQLNNSFIEVEPLGPQLVMGWVDFKNREYIVNKNYLHSVDFNRGGRLAAFSIHE